jgi:hypothetical protein
MFIRPASAHNHLSFLISNPKPAINNPQLKNSLFRIPNQQSAINNHKSSYTPSPSAVPCTPALGFALQNCGG